jgi:hypothetical protein
VQMSVSDAIIKDWARVVKFGKCPTAEDVDAILASNPNSFVGCPWWDAVCLHWLSADKTIPVDPEKHARAVFELQTQWYLMRACVGIVKAKARVASDAVYAAELRVREESKRRGKELHLGLVSLGKVGDLTSWGADVDDSVQYISAWELLVCAESAAEDTLGGKKSKKTMAAVVDVLTPASRAAFASALGDIKYLDGEDGEDTDRPMRRACRRWKGVLDVAAGESEKVQVSRCRLK